MTHEAVTVTETTDVSVAIDLMVGKRIRSLPAVSASGSSAWSAAAT
ncbi:CBS domain-containing protein [[Actinomadura] parvosata]|nr:CBS domain-containing protein [Nonomuraea sp. ATCC 55076]